MKNLLSQRVFQITHLLLFSFLFIPIFAAFATKPMSVQEKLALLETSSGGKIGLVAINTDNNQMIRYRADERFPMGCTSKMVGVAAILKKSMSNNKFLQERIYYQKSDLTSNSPITEKHLTDGMTIEELCAASISYSDNAAMNFLAKKLGGPEGINSFARSIGDAEFKLDHDWPKEGYGNLQNGEDSTTAAAMANSLQKIVLGEVLTNPQREKLQNWMKANVTGNNRIRAGVPKGWSVADKTGTGFAYGTTNDIAIIWPPKKAPVVITVFYSSTKKENPKREDVLASATRIVLESFKVQN